MRECLQAQGATANPYRNATSANQIQRGALYCTTPMHYLASSLLGNNTPQPHLSATIKFRGWRALLYYTNALPGQLPSRNNGGRAGFTASGKNCRTWGSPFVGGPPFVATLEEGIGWVQVGCRGLRVCTVCRWGGASPKSEKFEIFKNRPDKIGCNFFVRGSFRPC